MDQCTHDVRSAHWKEIIQNCQQRPTGQSIRSWLKDNGVIEQSYYYWQRKLRKEAYKKMDKSNLPSVQNQSNDVSFAEISMSVRQKPPVNCLSDIIQPVAVIKTATTSIAISNDISETILSMIFQEVSHA